MNSTTLSNMLTLDSLRLYSKSMWRGHFGIWVTVRCLLRGFCLGTNISDHGNSYFTSATQGSFLGLSFAQICFVFFHKF